MTYAVQSGTAGRLTRIPGGGEMLAGANLRPLPDPVKTHEKIEGGGVCERTVAGSYRAGRDASPAGACPYEANVLPAQLLDVPKVGSRPAVAVRASNSYVRCAALD